MPYTEHKYVYYIIYNASWGWKLENKLKNEVKIQNFPLKMSIKPNILCLRETT